MEEENQQQVKQEPQQVQRVTKEQQRVSTIDPKKVEAGKRLATINHKKREAKKREEQAQLEQTTSRLSQYYGIGAILALRVIGALGYYIYGTKKGEVPNRDLQVPAQRNPPQQLSRPQTNKSEMD